MSFKFSRGQWANILGRDTHIKPNIQLNNRTKMISPYDFRYTPTMNKSKSIRLINAHAKATDAPSISADYLITLTEQKFVNPF